MEATSQAQPAKVKLQKYLIHHKLAQSNKHVRKLIKEGKVYVNGVEARSVSIKVALDEKGSVLVKRESYEQTAANVNERDQEQELPQDSGDHGVSPPCIIFHKPCGMICTATLDPEYDTLISISPPIPKGFHPVGRLDQHSHGLLLFSSDGRLTSALLSPKSQVSREYTVIVNGDVGDIKYASIIQDVKNGVDTNYGTFQGSIIEMTRDVDNNYVHSQCDPNRGCRKDRHDSTETLDRLDGKQGQTPRQILSSITIKVEEGKKRMVRRLFAAIDLPVLDLRRNRYGAIKLPHHDNGFELRPGQWRFANEAEVAWCRNIMHDWNDGGKGWDIEPVSC